MTQTEPEALAALLAYITAQQLNDGDPLPAERQLALTLGVSRRKLREALSHLELEGRVWRGVGRGTFLGSRPQKFVSGFDALFRDTSPADVMEARFIIEPAVAALAATKASVEDLQEIEKCVRKNASARDDSEWQQWDHRFHHLIAQATRNQAMIALIGAMNSARAQPGWRSRRIATVDDEGRRRSAAQHREVYDALEARDPESASAAMRRHLVQVQTILLM